MISAPPRQSTNHLLMIRPSCFYANPETRSTNVFQTQDENRPSDLLPRARHEIEALTDVLLSAGASVTLIDGDPNCPDHLFPNWASTHEGRRVIFYPMMAANRQQELSPALRAALTRHYDVWFDWSDRHGQGLALESTASIVMDRINRIGYAALSDRTSQALVQEWGERTGYRMIPFSTMTPPGLPVYHTDVVMALGTRCALICLECIPDDAQRRLVTKSLTDTKPCVIDLSMDQMHAMCGNALEIRGANDQPFLVMSSGAHAALTITQKTRLQEQGLTLIHAPLPTLEHYGGGSARCALMELF